MSEAALDKKQVLTELTKSAHGKLTEYLPIGVRAAKEDTDFFAHLVAYNHVRGQVRDAKIALPIIALAAHQGPQRYAENALAHIADLRPRELSRALLATTSYDKTTKKSTPVPPFVVSAQAPRRILRRLVTRYLRDLEADKRQFEYVAVQHGHVLHELYAHYHVSRPAWVGAILFHGEQKQAKTLPSGIFDVIRRLHLMPVEEAAGTIVKYKIPFLIARGALGKKASEPDTVLALMKAMSPTELVTNIKWLEKLGVKTNPVLRAAFEAAIGKAATSKTPKATLKTTRAAEALADDDVLAGKLHALQEKQLDKLGGIEGDWLVLGDKSGSMHESIKFSREIAGILARMVKGKVHLIFFDTSPRYFDVTGKTLEEITKITAGMSAGGGTNMDCGIRYAIDNKIHVDGIAFVSDGANHGMPVIPTYRKYCEKMGSEPTIYFYQLSGEADVFSVECKRADVDLQTFDLRQQSVDYYSLPTLAATMRVARYSLLDEIMSYPLQSLDSVLANTIGMKVLPQALIHVVHQ